MKIAVISDIHGNLNALQAALAEIDREGVDCIINCGDTLGGPLASAKTADLLMARGIAMITGNHEQQLLTLPPEKLNRSDACTASEISSAHRAWLASAPATMCSSATVHRFRICITGSKPPHQILTNMARAACARPQRAKC